MSGKELLHQILHNINYFILTVNSRTKKFTLLEIDFDEGDKDFEDYLVLSEGPGRESNQLYLAQIYTKSVNLTHTQSETESEIQNKIINKISNSIDSRSYKDGFFVENRKFEEKSLCKAIDNKEYLYRRFYNIQEDFF